MIQRLVVLSLSFGISCTAYAQDAAKAKTIPEIDYVNMPFRGASREGPKTQYAKSANGRLLPVEAFADLDALQKALPPDDSMRSKYAKNMDGASRLPEELRNVSVVAYIHAAKLDYGIDAHGTQGDLCFQVILGTSPKHGEGRFFTAKVSALPKDKVDITTFSVARQQLTQLLMYVARVPGSEFHAKFAEVDRPIKVKVAGSLLFDGDRKSGIGPDYAKAGSVWEIHPVLSIDQQ